MDRRTFMGTAAATVVAASMQPAQAANTAKLRACVIGDTKHGGYGHSLHLVWALRDDVEVVALADPDEAGRKKNAAEAKAQHTYADYGEMLQTEKPDLVSIGPRWTIHHKEYIEAATAVGAHGLLEKPIASDLVEADAMCRTVEAKNLKWAIGFNFRATPIIAHVKRLVFDEGLIGDVLEMRGRGKEDERAGGEDLLVLGTHIFDMMRYFAGNPTWCASDITVGGRAATKADVHEATEPLGPIVGDRIRATYGFGNGLSGYFATTKNAQGNGGRWGLDLYGSKGIVTIRSEGGPKVRLLREPSWAPNDTARWEPLPNAPSTEIKNPALEQYFPIVADLITAIRENRRPQVSLQDGRDSLEMIQAVYEAYIHGGRVEFPLKDRSHPLKRW